MKKTIGLLELAILIVVGQFANAQTARRVGVLGPPG
jgi:hypothetical protein